MQMHANAAYVHIFPSCPMTPSPCQALVNHSSWWASVQQSKTLNMLISETETISWFKLNPHRCVLFLPNKMWSVLMGSLPIKTNTACPCLSWATLPPVLAGWWPKPTPPSWIGFASRYELQKPQGARCKVLWQTLPRSKKKQDVQIKYHQKNPMST